MRKNVSKPKNRFMGNHRGAWMVRLFLVCCLLFSCSCDHKKTTDEVAEWARNTLEGLSLEKKVAQLIVSDISGLYHSEDDPSFRYWISLAQEYGIGGFVLYNGNPLQTAHLLNRLQSEAEIPLLISADFEGGPGQQISGATEFPGNMGFAASRDENLMYRSAKAMAKEGRAMGIHLTYTPVVDILVSPDNPLESVRSFGGDVELLGRMVKEYVRGFNETGMLTTAKHFPGRGDRRVFPGFPGFTYLDKTEEVLDEQEFRAFKYAFDAGVQFVMTEHLAIPSVSGSPLPASVEPSLTKGVLRDKLGFTGIVTTDDLWYQHVTDRFGKEEVVVKALLAGHDLILKPHDPVAAIEAVIQAVKEGRISEDQINASVYKLLYQKALLGLNHNRFVDINLIGENVGIMEHKLLVQEVADKSITLLKNENVLPLDLDYVKNIVHIAIQKTYHQPNVETLISKISGSFGDVQHHRLVPNTGQTYRNRIIENIGGADLVIVSILVQRDRFGEAAPLRQTDISLVREIASRKPGGVVVMSYGNPFIVSKIMDVPCFLVGYGEGGWFGNQTVYFDSFIRVLKGELAPSGKLPVYVNDNYPIGFGLDLSTYY